MNLGKSVISSIFILLELIICYTFGKSIKKENLNKNENIKPLYNMSTRKRNESLTNFIAYFSGEEVIRYSNLNLNFDHFTIMFWIKVEGGQHEDVSIMRIYNHCSFVELTSLVIGLNTVNADTLVYFKMKASHSKTPTTLFSHQNVPILRWVHVAAVFDGLKMSLYINQAKVDVSYQNRGIFLSRVYPKCTTLDIGGGNKSQTYRGFLRSVVIHDTPLDHREIANSFTNLNFRKDDILLQENFDPSLKTFYGVYGVLPDIEPELLSPRYKHKHLDLNIPKCGFTLCDNPEIIQNYVSKPKIYLSRKTINYRVIQLLQDDQSPCYLTRKKILQIHNRLNLIFNAYDIYLSLHITKVKSSFLCNKTVLMSCYRPCPDSSVDCQQSTPTNHHQCQQQCTKGKLGNGRCDLECNNADNGNNWDGGDCCNPQITNVTQTCYDKSSVFRSFIEEREFKKYLNFTNHEYLTIHPVRLPSNFLGKSTYPWTDTVYGVFGGITISHESFESHGNLNDLIHEIGHAFGLWHVHRGVSEVSCNDACQETSPSMLTGDLCSDTNPTPTNYKCNAKVIHKGTCSNESIVYTNTPYKNFMSYVAGNCSNEFTPQQQARMHCYLDSNYQTWQPGYVPPSPVPLKPRLVSYFHNNVHITWHQPLGHGRMYSKKNCKQCNPKDHLLHQYVDKVIINNQIVTDNNPNSPSKIRGKPDAASKCNMDQNVWILQGNHRPNNNIIEVSFKYDVIPTALKIWVTYNAKNSISNVVLIHQDRSETSLGPVSTNCMVPFTTRIKVTKKVTRIRMHVLKDYSKPPGIDAILLISKREYPDWCHACSNLHLRYKVFRDPPFSPATQFKTVNEIGFTDKGIEHGTTYTYHIQAVSGSLRSRFSPPLVFKDTKGFCGNGKIEKYLGEECDDANLRDGDGCNVECKLEAIFNCKLEPSLCYRYDRDGICEDSEKMEQTRDCGLYTPNGYVDQWSKHVVGREGQSDSNKCPEDVINGTPPNNLKCVDGFTGINAKTAWRPCQGFIPETGEILEFGWIESTFQDIVNASAVVIYFASDGSFGPENETISLQVKDKKGKYHDAVDGRSIDINCKVNPLVIKINDIKNLPNIVAVRIKFEIGFIAIAGIALRSSTRKQCEIGEIFNSQSEKCEASKKEILPCPKLDLKFANVSCSTNQQSCLITCHAGYSRNQNSQIALCDHGTWTNTEDCFIVDCGMPKLQNTLISCPQTFFGSQCTFQCQDKTVMQGKDNLISCQHNGQWSIQKAHCTNVCFNEPKLLNGKMHHIQHEECLKDTTHRYLRPMGTRCRLKCQTGFFPKRKSLFEGENVINSHCNEHGVWQFDGKCDRITCPELTMYQKLLFKCTNNNKYQSICITTCLKTMASYNVTCLSSGKWSGAFDVCKTKGHCQKLVSIHKVDFSGCSQTSVGSSCLPSCGRMDLVLMERSAEKEFRSHVIYCMPNRQWLPKIINNLKCEEKCGPGIGDDYCDCINNRPHCMYDGGDCCLPFVQFLPGTPKCGCKQRG